jgi:hypothetical protein
VRKLAAVLLLVLVGCAMPGQAPLDTPGKRLIAADAQYSAVLATVNDAIDAGQLDPFDAEGKKVRGMLVSSKLALDAAHSAYDTGDGDTVIIRLTLAESAFAAIRAALLEAREKP